MPLLPIHSCCLNQQFLGNICPLRNVCGREGCDGLLQRLESFDVAFEELSVVEAFFDDDMGEAGQDRGILTRLALQVDMSFLGTFGLSGVDHNQLHAAAQGVVQPFGGIVLRDTTPFRNHRIGADQHPGIRIGERLRPGAPATVERDGHGLAGLVDAARGKLHRRADGLHERARNGGTRRIRERVGRCVKGHRTRAVLGNQVRQPGGDIVERGTRSHSFVSAGNLALGPKNPFRIVMLLRKLPAFDAGIPEVHRIFLVSDDFNGLAILDCYLYATERVAKTADRRLRLSHDRLPASGRALTCMLEGGAYDAIPALTRAEGNQDSTRRKLRINFHLSSHICDIYQRSWAMGETQGGLCV